MLLHAQQDMPPNDYICDVLLVQTLVLYGNYLYLLDDPRMCPTASFLGTGFFKF